MMANKNCKRWRKARRRKIRRLRMVDFRFAKKFPTNTRLHSSINKVDRYNRAVRRLNKNLQKPDGGYPICDGSVACPVCQTEHLTFGDTCQWTRNDNPARLHRSWDVDDYWPGMAQCCGLILAPDFEQRCVVIDEMEYQESLKRISSACPSLALPTTDNGHADTSDASLQTQAGD